MNLFQDRFDVHDIAYYLNITPRRVQMLVERGILPRGKRGEYELIPCLHAYIDHLKRKIYRMSGLNASKARQIYFMTSTDKPLTCDEDQERANNVARSELDDMDFEQFIQDAEAADKAEDLILFEAILPSLADISCRPEEKEKGVRGDS